MVPVHRWRRRFAIGLVAVAALVGGGATVWLLSHPPVRGRGPGFNVLLITLDTTRADRLGCYGYSGAHTPNIDRLAAEGTMFAKCMASAPSTLPSHATILTATYPFVHGVRHNVGFQLSEASATLAEALRAADYRTAAYVGAMVVNRDTGLDQGFDTYDDVGTRHERRADEVCAGAIEWLCNHADGPFFLWAHFFDPHAPYDPPEPYRTRHRDLYQGEIAFVDAQVGRLLHELRRLGLEQRTLVVLTADHGEGLGAHGEPTHLYFVYDTTMGVPLIFRCPGPFPAGRVIRGQVRTIDIAPTILAFLGLGSLPGSHGASLMPRITGQAGDDDLPAYGETLAGHIVLGVSPLRCLRTGEWKYILAPRPELFNIRRDPGEAHNLAARQVDRAAAMRDQLRAIVAASGPPVRADNSAVRLDGDTLDRLESLGYVAGDTSVSSSVTAGLERIEPAGDDPKDHVADFAALGQATHGLQTGQYARAEATYRRLASRFPGRAELGMQLARSMFLQGKFEEAIQVYRGLVERHPHNAAVHYGLGKLLDRIGKQEQAIDHFAAAVRIDPEHARAHYDLGVALMKVGRGDEAVECYRAALRVRPTYVDARVNLGVLLAARGELEDAIGQYYEALRVAPGDAAIHYNLGNALIRNGDRAGAARAYEEAVRLKPDFAEARKALQAARRGRPAEGSQP